jgi:hypothetical protein
MNNCLKLAYDNWENGTPRPNGYINNIGLTSSLFWIPHEIINFLQKANYEVKNVKLEDVEEDCYYIVNHQCSFEFVFGKKRWILSELVEEKVRNKNLKIIFLSEHESFDNIEIHLKNLKNLIIEKELKEENFYVLNNNSNLYETKHNLKTNINVFKTNWLVELVTEFNKDNINFIKEKKFTFLLHNRTPKSHRTGLLILLKKMGLLEGDIIDWSLLYPTIGHPFDAVYLDKNFIDIHSKELRPIYKEFLTVKKLSYYENDKNWFLDPSQYIERKYNELKSFEESYINIVTESHFNEKNIHITEKTFRPFLYLQIPIFLAGYKHVSKLKEEHPSLHLFEDLIDHSYDNEINNNKRLEMVSNEIKRLSEMKNLIQDYYILNELKIKENSSYILSFSNNKTTFNFFKNLISL